MSAQRARYGAGYIWLASAVWGATLAWAEPAALPTTAVTYQRLAIEETYDGLVEGVQQSVIAAEAAGRVVAVPYDVNARVSKGSVLVRLRDVAPAARLAQDEAGLQEAEAALREVQLDYDRVQAMYVRKLIAPAALDRAAAALDTAKARREAARARIAAAREQLAQTIVVAPYSGVVVARHVEVGEQVQPGQPLITLLAPGAQRVVVDVPQTRAEAVRKLGKARVIFADGRSIAIKSYMLFPAAEPQSHTLRVRLELPADMQGVYPGTTAKVAFMTGEERRLLVPRLAVVYRSEVTGVYVVAPDGRISLRQVRVGGAYNIDLVEALAGLDADERVALDPIRAGVLLNAQHAGKQR